ncbi:hypothetical protein O3M35_013256 [Rhynocoris fuscipes]|uniref:Uncharacterized protein n=1 Tax=Rhynocoris fuscipes TaxID=488301 RepID=A0AAW1CGD2_9HEMI
MENFDEKFNKVAENILNRQSELLECINNDEEKLNREIKDDGVVIRSDQSESSEDSNVIDGIEDITDEIINCTDSNDDKITPIDKNVYNGIPIETIDNPELEVNPENEDNYSLNNIISENILANANREMEQGAMMTEYLNKMTYSRKFTLENCNNYLLLVEENNNFHAEPFLIVLDEPDDLQMNDSKEEDIQHFRNEIIPEPITVHEMFKNFYVSTEQELNKDYFNRGDINKNIELFEGEDDDEDDMRARVYWSNVGLIREKPAHSLFRADEIPDSARPTLAKLNSEEELNLCIEQKGKSVRSKIMKHNDVKFVQPFGTRNKNFKRPKPEDKTKMEEKKIQITKVWNNLCKLFKVK